MHKIITSDFELDLTDVKITINEENSWFSDRFFTKYSYPFEFVATKEINTVLGDLMSYNSVTQTYIDCVYVFYNNIQSAVFIIEEIKGDLVTASIRYGFDEFPNFDKYLPEFDLIKKQVNDIYVHANAVVHQNYRQTNYNFPQIHTDKYDPQETQFNAFLKILNNRVDGIFIRNSVNDDDAILNKNIIQPVPYLLYLLKTGFLSAGYELRGEILRDELIAKILIYTNKDYFTKVAIEPLNVSISTEEHYDQKVINWEYSFYFFYKQIQIPRPGKYNLIGDLALHSWTINEQSEIYIRHNGVVIYEWRRRSAFSNTHVDLTIHVSAPDEMLEFFVKSAVRREDVLVNVQVLPIYFLNSQGQKTGSIVNENIVDLAKVVPNITFGQLVTVVTNLFNLDLVIGKDFVTMDFINTAFQKNTIHDFRDCEIVNPPRKLKSGVKYLLQYEDDSLGYDRVFVDINGMSVLKKEQRLASEKTISIGAAPLLRESRGVTTVKANDGGEDSISLVLYSGLVEGKNTALDPSPLLLSSIYNKYYSAWLRNRILSQEFHVEFLTPIERILNLKIKDRIMMYNNIHLVKNIGLTQIAKDLFQVELETEILKVGE
ncbi:hypothetical protein [Flavobacterium sp. NKUCC04_CG]|uniref:hypothetical protein n=1 Tax=Flavobacterium sp. NKUCC04_CG TaxID=2842121 RepID=UPI001C5ADE3C|nr:hypothetical protein [Flavobacterium sp. NKUCC04_CG]MBW3519489.1 hypothetical protein [Flavobacterium sp. NKUCC04_CG]